MKQKQKLAQKVEKHAQHLAVVSVAGLNNTYTGQDDLKPNTKMKSSEGLGMEIDWAEQLDALINQFTKV